MNRITEIFDNAEVSEKAIEHHLVKRMEQLGGRALKYYNTQLTGYPDRLCLLPGGVVFWVELKSRGKKLRPLQQHRHEELLALGQKVYTCDSIPQVEAALKEQASVSRGFPAQK